MKTYKMSEMKNGWFIGDFEPSILKTDKFEVALHKNKAGCETHTHYHKKTTEYNVVVHGKMIINGKELKSGDIFVLEPYEVSESQFLEDTILIVVKEPSIPSDKFKAE